MLPLVAIALSLGIAAGDALSIGVLSSSALLALLVLLLLFAWRRDRLVGSAILAVSLALGLVAESGARPRPALGLIGPERRTVEGVVLRDPERSFGKVRVLIGLEWLQDGVKRRRASDNLLLTVEGSLYEPLLPGDRVEVPIVLRAAHGFANPGALDSERHLAARGVVALGGVHDPAALCRLAEPPRRGLWIGLLRATALVRARLAAELASRLNGPPRVLLAALILGDRGEIDPALDQAFRAAGVSHVLSVSGLHLAIAAFLFYGGLVRLLLFIPGVGRGRPVCRAAAICALPATVLYTLLTGAEVATVRSCLAACVWLFGVASERRAGGLQSLSLAGLAILLLSPLELFEPSFQLSFAAALGIVILVPRLTPTVDPHRGIGARLLHAALRLWATSLAALLCTAPLCLWHFAELSPAGLVSNLVVVPLAELLLVPSGLAGCVLAALHIPLGDSLIRLAALDAELLLAVVRAIAAHAPSLRLMAPAVWELGLWYLALGCLAWGRRSLALGMAVGVLALAAVRLVATQLSTDLVATFLDVGQGDACVLEFPHGRVAVVDGGGSFEPSYNPGEEIIAPFLWRHGIRHIDLLVLSHPHPDHANGLGYLAEAFPIDEIWTNGAPTTLPGVERLIGAAAKHHVPVTRPHPVVLGGARLRALGPHNERGELAPDLLWSENDNSLVVAVEYAGRRLLFPGDVEREAEAALARQGSLFADVLKVPHHGSRTSSTIEFVAAVHPHIAVVSASESNRWGFPHAEVLARYAEIGAALFRTDRDGAVTVVLDATGRLRVRRTRELATAAVR